VVRILSGAPYLSIRLPVCCPKNKRNAGRLRLGEGNGLIYKLRMSELVANCPRCGSIKMTFDVKIGHYVYSEYGWLRHYEVFCVCRHCDRSIVFRLESKSIPLNEQIDAAGALSRLEGSLNAYLDVEGFISLKDTARSDPPEYLPKNIANAFREGATCLAVECFNAAGTMFRLCVDLATRPLLPTEEVQGLTSKIRRDLGLRLPWLFNNSKLPGELRDLSSCIKEDGNDGAHAGTLTKADAEDLLEFAHAFLERLYTEPEKLRLAHERRNTRRKPPETQKQ
jgi:hypothetical protein